MRRLLLLSLLLLPGLVHADPAVLASGLVPAPAFYWWAGKQDPNTVPYTEISTQGVAAMQVVNIGNSYGRIGRMANFNGTGSSAGSRFSFGISTSLTNAPEFTIAVWGRFNASNTNATVLTICDASNNESGNIQYRYNPTPRICLQTWNNACKVLVIAYSSRWICAKKVCLTATCHPSVTSIIPCFKTYSWSGIIPILNVSRFVITGIANSQYSSVGV